SRFHREYRSVVLHRIAARVPAKVRHSFLGGISMRRMMFLMLSCAVTAAFGDEPAKESTLIARPEALQPMFSPDCSHCKPENSRRKAELRADDRVLCFRQVFND